MTMHLIKDATACEQPKRAFFLGTTALTLVAALLLNSGCGSTPSASASSVTLQPIRAPYRPLTTVVYCSDTTASYDRQLLWQADTLMADLLDAAIQPNADQLTAYITWLDGSPFAPNATPLVIQIPALPAQPALPQLVPTPAPSGDPYADANKRIVVERENAATQRAYQQALAHQNAQLEQVRRAVHQQTEPLRKLRPPIAYSTSVYGCLALASERFAQVSGDKYLVIASDLQNTTLRDYVAPRTLAFQGVKIRVVFLQCVSAPECRATTAYWRGVFEAAGAQNRDVAFYDPSTSRTLDVHTVFGSASP